MSLRNVLCFSAVVLLLGAASTAQADVPQLLNYQGVLKSGGSPVTTPVNVTFTIYDAESSGNAVWTQGLLISPDAEGAFNVLLGQTVGLGDSVFTGPDRWLGVQVESDPEMTPRVRIVSVGYAYRVGTVDGAEGGTISGDVSIQSDLAVSGKVSIGPGHTNTGTDAFVAGSGNTASGIYSAVGGGASNVASGDFATVLGGVGNRAGGNHSLVAGLNAKASHDHTFVWNGAWDIDSFYTTAHQQFLINAPGGVGINTNTPGYALEVIGNVDADGFSINGVPLSTSSDSYWNQSGSDIYYNTGDVGIGTATPEAKLHVVGEIKAIGDLILDGVINSPTDTNYAGIVIRGVGGDDTCMVITSDGGPQLVMRTMADMARGTIMMIDDATDDTTFSLTNDGGPHLVMRNMANTTRGSIEMHVEHDSTLVAYNRFDGYTKTSEHRYFADDDSSVVAYSWFDAMTTEFVSGINFKASNANCNLQLKDGTTDVLSFEPNHIIMVHNDDTTMSINTCDVEYSGPDWGAIGWGAPNCTGDPYFRIIEDTGTDSTRLSAGGMVLAIINGDADFTAEHLMFRNSLGNTAINLNAGTRTIALHNSSGWETLALTEQGFVFDSSGSSGALTTLSPGGTTIYSNLARSAGVTLGAGGSSWSSVSDRNLKDNFTPIDAREVLDKVASLPMSTWNYKAQDESIRHMGPMAQDLYAAFELGTDDKHINTIDADGVALAAIQGLYQQNLDLKERVEHLEELVRQMLEDKE